MTGDIVISENRQATLDYFKIDRKCSNIATGDIAILEIRQATLGGPIKGPVILIALTGLGETPLSHDEMSQSIKHVHRTTQTLTLSTHDQLDLKDFTLIEPLDTCRFRKPDTPVTRPVPRELRGSIDQRRPAVLSDQENRISD